MSRYVRTSRAPRPPLLRRIPRIILIAVVSLPLIGLLYGSGLLDGPRPPVPRLNYAKEAIERAADAGAIAYAPAQYRRAEKLVQQGWMEMARQNGRVSLFRNYKRADSLLVKAIGAAEDGAQIAQDSLGSLDRRAQNEIRQLEEELKSWREALDGTFIIYNAERFWSDAEIRLKQARQLARVKEYQSAHDVVIVAHKALERVATALAEMAEDEAANMRSWRIWVEDALAHSRETGATAVIVDKAAHKTYLVDNGRVIKTYESELGYNSARPKLFQGDGATPEGVYKIVSVKNGNSKYYKALLLNYPNDADKRRFAENKRKGVISARAGIGKLIEIHGDGGYGKDWTDGCVALANGDMDHIMKFVGLGTPVVIVRRYDGFR